MTPRRTSTDSRRKRLARRLWLPRQHRALILQFANQASCAAFPPFLDDSRRNKLRASRRAQATRSPWPSARHLDLARKNALLSLCIKGGDCDSRTWSMKGPIRKQTPRGWCRGLFSGSCLKGLLRGGNQVGISACDLPHRALGGSWARSSTTRIPGNWWSTPLPQSLLSSWYF